MYYTTEGLQPAEFNLEEQNMRTEFNVTGSERKRLVQTIAQSTGESASYKGAPSMAYEVGPFTVDRDGTLEFSDNTDSEVVEKLYEDIVAAGFAFPNTPEIPDTGLQILLPLDGFDSNSLDRLTKLIDSKASLIRKALGADRLTVQLRNDAVCFPWWDTMPSPEETSAYTAFIAALCRMAKEAKRVNATEKDVESEKYAFRGFLLRLGFIGADSKNQRKLLLKNLSGSGAFPNREKAEAFSAAQKAKREAAKEVTA